MIQEIMKKDNIRMIYSPMKHLYKVQEKKGVWKEIGQYKSYTGAEKRFNKEIESR